MSEFLQGLAFWVRGWVTLIRRPKLLALALVPLLSSIALTVTLVIGVFFQLPHWARYLTGFVQQAAPLWVQTALYYSIVLGAGFLVIISFTYIAYLIHALISSPFYSVIAEKVLVDPGSEKKLDWRERIRLSWMLFKITLLKAVLYLFLGAVLFLMSLLPGLNAAALFCTWALVAYDCLDFSFEILGLSWRERMRRLFEKRLLWMGMSFGLALTLLIPGLTLLVIPGAIVGAAQSVRDKNESPRTPS